MGGRAKSLAQTTADAVSLSAEMARDGTVAIKDVTRVPAQRLRANSAWASQKVLFLTNLFGKEYYWMQDGDGTIYLAKVGTNGLPDLS